MRRNVTAQKTGQVTIAPWPHVLLYNTVMAEEIAAFGVAVCAWKAGLEIRAPWRIVLESTNVLDMGTARSLMCEFNL